MTLAVALYSVGAIASRIFGEPSYRDFYSAAKLPLTKGSRGHEALMSSAIVLLRCITVTSGISAKGKFMRANRRRHAGYGVAQSSR